MKERLTASQYADKQRMATIAAMEARPRPSGWWRANCPFCTVRKGRGDKDGSFAVQVATGIYVCMRCGTSGKLKDGHPNAAQAPNPTELEKSAKQAPPDFHLLSTPDAKASELLMPAREYLLNRGVSEEIITQAQIGACLEGPAANRVVVPVLNDTGDEWLGWVGRDYTKKARFKYRVASGMPRERILYNHRALFDLSDEGEDAPLFVVEGVFDALAIGRDGVAVFGTPTDEQVRMLAASPRPKAIVLDGDAHELGWSVAARLRLEGTRAGYVKLPPTLDPDQVEKSWLYDEARACWSKNL